MYVSGRQAIRDIAEAALDHLYGRSRRIGETLIGDKSGMVNVEVVPALPESDRPSV
jgi:hypothetical protein